MGCSGCSGFRRAGIAGNATVQCKTARYKTVFGPFPALAVTVSEATATAY
jgi:hypothetical protein